MRQSIALATIAVALVTSTAEARRDRPLDVSKLTDKMTVYHDGQGHYLVVWSDTVDRRLRRRYFYGDGKRFHEMTVFSSNKDRNGDVHVSFKDPRMFEVALTLEQNGVTTRCRRTRDESSNNLTRLTPVAAAAAAKLLDRARFFKPPFTRTAHALARDAMGVYYYVDHAALVDGVRERRDYHLYIGPPGAMKRQRLVSVADDSVGQVFATRKGALQVRRDRDGNRYHTNAFAWIKANRKDRIELTNVPAYLNERVIFETLAVYGAVRFGTHCDDL